MIIRPKGFRHSSICINERVKLAAGEAVEGCYDIWRSRLAADPLFCTVHPRIKRIVEQSSRRFWQANKLDPHWHEPRETEQVEVGTFNFRAFLNCPVCRATYALCPPEFHETSFDSFDISTPERAKALAICREFAAQVNLHGRGFGLFVGGVGSGKTRLACNIVR